MRPLVFALFFLCAGSRAGVGEEKSHPLRQWDYIIVGGGPAGITLATRLSENPLLDVLLIEAGLPAQAQTGGKDLMDDYDNLTKFDVPLEWDTIAFSGGVNHTKFFKKYHWDIAGAEVARALGGCGIHNGMLYLRGVQQDFEEWNVPGWSWEEVYPMYLKSENNTDFKHDPSKHGTTGPMQVGHPYVEDFNAENSSRAGVGWHQFNVREGVRDSAAVAYLRLAQGRPNLRILTSAEALKVIISDSAPRAAIGVEYMDQSHEARGKAGPANRMQAFVKAKGEVVLSAGALNTPKLLMLSGIGDEALLEPLGIPSVADIKGVGKNLHDSSMVVMQWELDDAVATQMCKDAEDVSSLYCRRQKVQYDQNRTGLFSTTGISLGAFLTSELSKTQLGKPDVQVTVLLYDVNRHWATDPAFNVTGRVMTWTLTLNNPKSRGSVKLNPDCPQCAPAQWANYYQDGGQHDISVMQWAVNETKLLIRSSPLTGLVKRELYPGSDMNASELNIWIACGPVEGRAACNNNCCTPVVNHFGGTAKMGDRVVDLGAVVDPELRVYGVDALRVVDASVMPSSPSGNPHATVVMIAEHAAQLIRQKRCEQGLPGDADCTGGRGSAAGGANHTSIEGAATKERGPKAKAAIRVAESKSQRTREELLQWLRGARQQ